MVVSLSLGSTSSVVLEEPIDEPTQSGTDELTQVNLPPSDWREEVLRMVEEAGFNREVAKDIIQCESGWNPQAKNLNDPNGGSFGIWQINGIHGLTIEQMTDPIESTKFAIELMKSKRSYRHWSCYYE